METEEKNRKIVDNVGGKVVDKKLPNPVGVLRRKTDALCVKLQLRGVGLKSWGWSLKDRNLIDKVLISGLIRKPYNFQAKEFNYPHLKKAKNTIKIKRSSVFFSSFVSALAWWSTSLSFRSRRSDRWLGCWLDGWPGHRWCSVDGLRGRCRLVRMIFVERADELPKVLNGRCRLPGIFFFWITFPRNQIVEPW